MVPHEIEGWPFRASLTLFDNVMRVGQESWSLGGEKVPWAALGCGCCVWVRACDTMPANRKFNETQALAACGADSKAPLGCPEAVGCRVDTPAVQTRNVSYGCSFIGLHRCPMRASDASKAC